MTGVQASAGFVVALGAAAVLFGALPFAGGRTRPFFKQLWARGTWNFGPSATVALVPIGLGLSVLGIALLIREDGLIFVSFAAMIAGAAIYITDPRWLRPRWTRPK